MEDCMSQIKSTRYGRFNYWQVMLNRTLNRDFFGQLIETFHDFLGKESYK